MDYLDAAIVLLLLLFAVSGFRRGFSWVGLSICGLLAGLLVGALVAPLVAKAITHNKNAQPLIAIGLFLAITFIVQGLGTAIGFRVRVRTARTRLSGADSALGAVLAILGVLASTWYVGLVFVRSPWVALDQQITDSRIIRTLDSYFPRPPGFLSSLQNLFSNTDFPNPFASILPPPAPVTIPPLVDTPGIHAAAVATSKVVADGCGGGEAGSSWPVAANYLVTNAHVVAGSQHVEVDTPDGAVHTATVVLFDPNVDVAVLYVPGLGLTPLGTVAADPARDTTGAVIGYPGGGNEQVVPAAVSGTERATGYNIYGDTLVTRDMEVLAAHVIPGNSGGPIVDDNGAVIGLVFAASTTDANTGYALTISQIAPDITSGTRSTAPVSTENCTS